MKIAVLVLIILLSLSIGCIEYKPLTDDLKEYAGVWASSDGQYLTIHEDGSGSYDGYSGIASLKVSGGQVVIADGNLSIEFVGIGKKFRIDKSPYDDTGKTKMILDGVNFVKGSN
ncbi:MAG: hypothetical protein WCW44_01535 [archaeon]|jgi:hypothetical protein